MEKYKIRTINSCDKDTSNELELHERKRMDKRRDRERGIQV